MEVEAGTYIRPEKMTFQAFVDQWIRKFVNVDLEEKTKENYLFHTEKRILPYFGHMHMDRIKPMHINDFLEYLRSPEARLDGQAKPLVSPPLFIITVF